MSWRALQVYSWRAALALWLLLPTGARAQSAGEQLDRAKALFREGNALLAAGDPERALDRFLASREAVPSGKNTANAAICLERLGRLDEALEMYEELLARFAADLDDQDRQNVAPIMAGLRRRLGSLEIAANVEGSVTIDGRPRGGVPRATAWRVMPGKHRVRVVKEGYQSFDQVVDIVAESTMRVDASLEPLSGMGAVRVELTGGAVAQVLIDGKTAGVVPWEGTLRTGRHLLQVVGHDEGSKPESLQVLERKTLLVRVTSRKLGPATRISSYPASATLSLDGVPIGSGNWSGRLPVGSYTLRADEPGYFSRSIEVTPAQEGGSVRIDLQQDVDDPRWPRQRSWYFGVGLAGGLLYAPTLKGDQETACPKLCTGRPDALGGHAEALLEARYGHRFGAELAGGYLLAQQSFTRAAFDSNATSRVTYALDQELALGGVYARASGFALLRLAKGFDLRPSVGVGVGRIAYEARSHGIAWTTGEPTAAAGLGFETMRETMPFVTGGFSVERAVGPLRLALGITAWFVPTYGPRFPGVELATTPSCGTDPAAVGCAPASDLLSKERSHGPFVAISPELAARYSF